MANDHVQTQHRERSVLCGQGTHDLSRKHWSCVEKIAIQYLKYARIYTWPLRRGKDLDLIVYPEPDYAGGEEHWRLSPGGTVMCVGAYYHMFAMFLKNSTLRDYLFHRGRHVAMGDCVQETLFIRSIFLFIKPRTKGQRGKLLVHEKNEGANRLIKDPPGSAHLWHRCLPSLLGAIRSKARRWNRAHWNYASAHRCYRKASQGELFNVYRNFLLNRIWKECCVTFFLFQDAMLWMVSSCNDSGSILKLDSLSYSLGYGRSPDLRQVELSWKQINGRLFRWSQS